MKRGGKSNERRALCPPTLLHASLLLQQINALGKFIILHQTLFVTPLKGAADAHFYYQSKIQNKTQRVYSLRLEGLASAFFWKPIYRSAVFLCLMDVCLLMFTRKHIIYASIVFIEPLNS